MSFANLTLAQFLLLAAAGAALIVLLSLRGKRHDAKEVSSLQFWVPLAETAEQSATRRIGNLTSLLLQLACFFALLAAIAWPTFKSRFTQAKQHILLVDTSAWTQQNNGHGEILEQEKTLVRRYVNTLPPRDQVMLTTVDSLVVARTPLTTDRIRLETALRDMRPTLLALDLREVEDFARQTRSLASAGNAEVLYLGPGQIGEAQPGDEAFRSYLVDPASNHCGIRRAGLERAEQSPGTWQMMVALENYGATACHLQLTIRVAHRDLPERDQYLAPGQQAQAEYRFDSTQSELLTVSLVPGDSLAADQTLTLRLPPLAPTRVALFTARPDRFRKLIDVLPNASVSVRKPQDYQPDPRDIDLAILDGVAPAAAPAIPALWVTPPSEQSTFAHKSEVPHPAVFAWNRDSALARGLFAQDLPVATATAFQLSAGDTPVLSIADGPVVVARSTGTRGLRSAVLGFDPTSEKVRYEVTTPLLWMNLVQWLAASSLSPSRIEIGPAGDAVIHHEKDLAPGDVRLSTANTPRLSNEGEVRFFAAEPTVARYSEQGTPQEIHLVLPQLAQSSGRTLRGLRENPVALSQERLPQLESWRWLVLAGLALASVEWYLFGGLRRWRKRGYRP